MLFSPPNVPKCDTKPLAACFALSSLKGFVAALWLLLRAAAGVFFVAPALAPRLLLLPLPLARPVPPDDDDGALPGCRLAPPIVCHSTTEASARLGQQARSLGEACSVVKNALYSL